jgi:hypothetical protein
MTLIPRIKLTKFGTPTVHIYGLPHGWQEEGGLPQNVHTVLNQEAKTFHSKDYVMIEGPNPEHSRRLIEKTGGKKEAKIRHMMNAKVGTIFKIQVNQAENPEYYMNLEMRVDPNLEINQYMENELNKADWDTINQELNNASTQSIMSPTAKSVKKIKNNWTQELYRAFKNSTTVSKNHIKQFVEFRTTFRSLLMAQTARSRAETLGNDVRFFTGYLHSDEAAQFIKKPKTVQKYLEGLKKGGHQELLHMYQEQTMINQNIADAFHQTKNRVPIDQHSAYLQYLAFRLHEHILDQHFQIPAGELAVSKILTEFKQKSGS